MATASIHSEAEELLPVAVSIQVSTWIQWTMQLFVFAIVFLNGADFLGKTGEDEFTMHWQIWMRLLVSGCCGLIGLFWLFPLTYRDFLTWPGFLVGIFVAWNGVSVVFSIDPTYSLAAWFSLVGVVLFIPAAMRILGGYRLLLTLGFSTLLYLAGSWLAFWYFPDVGIWREKITQTVTVERMGGLGHPNELGFYSTYTILVFLALVGGRRVDWRLSVPVLLLAVVTLITCFSRTSMLVTMLGLPVACQAFLRSRGIVVAGVLACALGILVVFFVVSSGKIDWFIEDALVNVTKSGSTSELTTATGRTAIWAYGIQKIIESPVFGYGYCTSRFVMIDHSYHCHNVVLNSAMYSGVLTGVVVAIALSYLLYCLVFQPEFAVDGLAVVLLGAGMVEEMIGAPSPSVNLFVFVMLIFWRQLGMTIIRFPNDSETELLPATIQPR